MSKIAVFGIDGGTLSLIEQWKEELPTFKRIIEGGVYGELLSTVPALTSPAWPCMFTGKNPGKLGIYDFLKLELSEGHMPRVIDSTDYHSSSLWKILNDYGKKTGLLNVPVTYPAHKINGFVVCGVGAPEIAGIKYTYPSELKKTLDEVVGDYEITSKILLTLYNQEEKCLLSANEILGKRVQAAKYLINNYPCDLFVCAFFMMDFIQHYFWRHMDVSHPKHIAGSKYKNAIKDFYKRIDEAIAMLIGELPADTNIFIVSDHGFGSCYGGFSLNKWLENNGYLKFKHSMHHKRTSDRLRDVRDVILPHLSTKIIQRMVKIIPQKIANKMTASGESEDRMFNLYRDVDWDKTRAYALGTSTGGIFVRNVGGEYEKIREEIIDKLCAINDPYGKPLGMRIIKKEEIYSGKYFNQAPDIFIELGSSKYYPMAFGDDTFWIDYAISGSHIPQGLFMAYGRDIKQEGTKLSDLKIYDITPTILYAMNTPIPEDMDGRVLDEIFRGKNESSSGNPLL